VLLAGCGRRSAGFTTDGLDTLYKPQYASGFALLRAGENSSILSIADPWQGAEGVRMNVFLSRDGERAPDGFDGAVVDVPLRRVVCMSTSYVGFLDALGADDAVVGVSGVRFVSNEKVRAAAQEVGYDALMNYELIAALKPDAVLVYGIAGENTQATSKLKELGIPYIYVGEYVERSPLGRAEWVVAFGEMMGRRAEAEEVFAAVRDSYLAAQQSVSHSGARPRVIFNAPYRDVWYLPAAGSYMVQLVADAGGCYDAPVEETNESAAVASEQAYLSALKADVWLNPGQAATLDDVLRENPRFAKVPSVAGGQVYNNNARTTPAGGNDFWESGAVRPDVVLRDFVKILHPELLPDHELYYYRQML
jgi:iron complex transport system substrate-binding protein